MNRNAAPSRFSAGFTLLEMVIAITLVSLLFVGVFGCVRLGIDTLTRVDAKLMRERRVAGVERIMRAELEGIMPVTLECSSGSDTPGTRIPFFEGRPETMRLISSYSLNEAYRGVPRLLEYQVIPGADGNGVRLIVNERPYIGSTVPGLCGGMMADPETNAPVPQFASVAIGTSSFVLADRLASCSFSYRRPPDRGRPVPEWVPVWSGNLLPDAIHIDMAQLHASPSELDLQPLTVPLHVSRDPMGLYAQ